MVRLVNHINEVLIFGDDWSSLLRCSLWNVLIHLIVALLFKVDVDVYILYILRLLTFSTILNKVSNRCVVGILRSVHWSLIEWLLWIVEWLGVSLWWMLLVHNLARVAFANEMIGFNGWFYQWVLKETFLAWDVLHVSPMQLRNLILRLLRFNLHWWRQLCMICLSIFLLSLISGHCANMVWWDSQRSWWRVLISWPIRNDWAVMIIYTKVVAMMILWRASAFYLFRVSKCHSGIVLVFSRLWMVIVHEILWYLVNWWLLERDLKILVSLAERLFLNFEVFHGGLNSTNFPNRLWSGMIGGFLIECWRLRQFIFHGFLQTFKVYLLSYIPLMLPWLKDKI